MAALHGPRLRMLLSGTIDTTVRGIVYEAAGTAGAEVLAAGMAEIRRAREINEIPFAVVDAEPAVAETWAVAAREAIDGLIAVR